MKFALGGLLVTSLPGKLGQEVMSRPVPGIRLDCGTRILPGFIEAAGLLIGTREVVKCVTVAGIQDAGLIEEFQGFFVTALFAQHGSQREESRETSRVTPNFFTEVLLALVVFPQPSLQDTYVKVDLRPIRVQGIEPFKFLERLGELV